MAITLITVPGWLVEDGQRRAFVIDLYGHPVLQEIHHRLTSVEDIKGALAHFGASVRKLYPDASYRITVRLGGAGPPNQAIGRAIATNALGQDDYLHVRGCAATAGTEQR